MIYFKECRKCNKEHAYLFVEKGKVSDTDIVYSKKGNKRNSMSPKVCKGCFFLKDARSFYLFESGFRSNYCKICSRKNIADIRLNHRNIKVDNLVVKN